MKESPFLEFILMNSVFHSTATLYFIVGNFGREFFLPKADAKNCGKNLPDLFSRMPTNSESFKAQLSSNHGREPA